MAKTRVAHVGARLVFCLAAPATGAPAPPTISRSPHADENFLPGPSPGRSSYSTMASMASQVKQQMSHTMLRGLLAAHPLWALPFISFFTASPCPAHAYSSLPDPPTCPAMRRDCPDRLHLLGLHPDPRHDPHHSTGRCRADEKGDYNGSLPPHIFYSVEQQPITASLGGACPPQCLRPSPSSGRPLTESTTHGRLLVCLGLFRRRSLGAAVHERERDGKPVL